MFRSRNHFRMPPVRLAPIVLGILACLVLAGLVALSFLDPKPPTRHFEVPVPNDRLAR
jgi:hypothetical protein